MSSKEPTVRPDPSEQRLLSAGRSVTVDSSHQREPRTSFDCCGLALDWRERVNLAVIEQGYRSNGPGRGGQLPRDESP